MENLVAEVVQGHEVKVTHYPLQFKKVAHLQLLRAGFPSSEIEMPAYCAQVKSVVDSDPGGVLARNTLSTMGGGLFAFDFGREYLFFLQADLTKALSDSSVVPNIVLINPFTFDPQLDVSISYTRDALSPAAGSTTLILSQFNSAAIGAASAGEIKVDSRKPEFICDMWSKKATIKIVFTGTDSTATYSGSTYSGDTEWTGISFPK
jgi:hypothetical protein